MSIIVFTNSRTLVDFPVELHRSPSPRHKTRTNAAVGAMLLSRGHSEYEQGAQRLIRLNDTSLELTPSAQAQILSRTTDCTTVHSRTQ